MLWGPSCFGPLTLLAISHFLHPLPAAVLLPVLSGPQRRGTGPAPPDRVVSSGECARAKEQGNQLLIPPAGRPEDRRRRAPPLEAARAARAPRAQPFPFSRARLSPSRSRSAPLAPFRPSFAPGLVVALSPIPRNARCTALAGPPALRTPFEPLPPSRSPPRLSRMPPRPGPSVRKPPRQPQSARRLPLFPGAGYSAGAAPVTRTLMPQLLRRSAPS